MCRYYVMFSATVVATEVGRCASPCDVMAMIPGAALGCVGSSGVERRDVM